MFMCFLTKIEDEVVTFAKSDDFIFNFCVKITHCVQ